MDTAEGDDHYEILGLPSGEEGAKLTPEDIKKAYRAKALSSHPDKRPHDPHAHSTFQKITSSYEILKNPKARKAFDALLRARNDRFLRRVFHLDPNRRRMMSDLEERERAAFADDLKEKDRTEEERAARKFQEEVTRIREMHAKKKTAVEGEGSGTGEGLEKARVLKVSWERDGEDYSAERLKKLFTRFGKVEDVVIRDKGSKKKRSALVVMATKEVAVAATQSMRGDISNPLDVVPLHPDDNHSSSTPPMKHAKSNAPNLSNLVGAGYQAYEDSILKKLQKAAEKQKS